MNLRNLLTVKKLTPKPQSGDKYNTLRQIKEEIKTKGHSVRKAKTLEDLLNNEMKI